MGMTLDESTDGLTKVESDGLDFYLDPNLVSFLRDQGEVHIDYVTVGNRSGYTVRVGTGDCSDHGCSGCG